MSRRRAFEVVDQFEQALCEYTLAPYAVATDSCTNAIFLAALWQRRMHFGEDGVSIPRQTYIGVLQALKNAGYWDIRLDDRQWSFDYEIEPLKIIDSAKWLPRGTYRRGTFTCVSFQASKTLPIGRGGAILHDSPEADEWFRRARFDGRVEGETCDAFREVQSPGFHMYMTPPDAARGLWLLTYLDDDDPNDWTGYPDLREIAWS